MNTQANAREQLDSASNQPKVSEYEPKSHQIADSNANGCQKHLCCSRQPLKLRLRRTSVELTEH